MSASITAKSLFQYGFIALPIAFAGFPLYVLAPDFYATRHGLSLTLLGGLLLAIRMFDAVQDPLIGWLTDKLQARFLPIVIAAGTVLCLAVFGLFNGVIFSPAIWFTLSMFLAVSAYSILTITLGAQATLWTEDRDDQTRIAGVREAFGLVGLVTAVSIPIPLSQIVNPDQVYLWYSAILAVLMLAGTIAFSRLGLFTKVMRNQAQNISFLSVVRAFPKESIRFFGVYALSMLASSIPAVLVIFYVRDLLGAEHLTGLFLLLYFLSGVAAMPLWKKLSVRVGKYKAWGLSNLLAVIGFIGAVFLGSGDIWAYGAVCVLSGMALGADLTLPPSILADQIHARGNAAFSGTYCACLAFIAKASLALASALALPGLDAAGFKPQSVNSETALLTLSVAYAVVPCALKLLSASLLYGYFGRSQSGGNHEDIHNNSNYRSSHHA